jgi:hypothetical protein
MSDFRKWWMDDDGSQKWPEALDAEGGTLKALEMVFNAGMTARTAELETKINELEAVLKQIAQGHLGTEKDFKPTPDALLAKAVLDTNHTGVKNE